MTRLTRAFVRFQKHPSSVRYASAAIIGTTVVLVLAGALLMRVFAPESYPTFAGAVWFTLQTVTTVGYGDSTPTSFVGRLVASIVMVVSIAMITVITAGVTSLLVRSVGRELQEEDQRTLTETLSRIESSLAAAHERLDRLGGSAPTDRDGSDSSRDGHEHSAGS